LFVGLEKALDFSCTGQARFCCNRAPRGSPIRIQNLIFWPPANAEAGRNLIGRNPANLIVGWCGQFLFFVVPRQFRQVVGEWPGNQILIPNWTNFHCPGTTLFRNSSYHPGKKLFVCIREECQLLGKSTFRSRTDGQGYARWWKCDGFVGRDDEIHSLVVGQHRDVVFQLLIEAQGNCHKHTHKHTVFVAVGTQWGPGLLAEYLPKYGRGRLCNRDMCSARVMYRS